MEYHELIVYNNIEIPHVSHNTTTLFYYIEQKKL